MKRHSVLEGGMLEGKHEKEGCGKKGIGGTEVACDKEKLRKGQEVPRQSGETQFRLKHYYYFF